MITSANADAAFSLPHFSSLEPISMNNEGTEIQGPWCVVSKLIENSSDN